MSRWFRHYAGLCRDEKLVSAAIKAKQPVERVVWVWCAILESAAEIDDDGRYNIDPAEMAYFLRTDEDDILAITAVLGSLGRVHEGHVVKWGNRQFKSDRSAERVAAHRQRAKLDRGNTEETGHGGERNQDVTLQKRYCNAPDTETDTELDISLSSLRSDREGACAPPPDEPVQDFHELPRENRELDEPVPERNPLPEKPKRSLQGHRLPDDWRPSREDFAYARDRGLSPKQVNDEIEKFRNHWQAKPGKDALKLDWSKTWRNWALKALQFNSPRGQGPPRHVDALGNIAAALNRNNPFHEQAKLAIKDEFDAGRFDRNPFDPRPSAPDEPRGRLVAISPP